MSIANSGQQFFDETIKAAIASRIEVIIAEETAKAKVAVGDRMRSELAQITLNVLSHYRAEQRGSELVIHVINESGGNR